MKFKEGGLRYFRKLERKRERMKKLLERIGLKQQIFGKLNNLLQKNHIKVKVQCLIYSKMQSQGRNLCKEEIRYMLTKKKINYLPGIPKQVKEFKRSLQKKERFQKSTMRSLKMDTITISISSIKNNKNILTQYASTKIEANPFLNQTKQHTLKKCKEE